MDPVSPEFVLFTGLIIIVRQNEYIFFGQANL